MSKQRTVLTPECRMSFPHLLVAKEFIEKGKPSGKFSYQVELLFGEEALGKFRVLDSGKLVETNIENLLVGLAKEAWGDETNPATGQPLTVRDMFAGVAVKGWPLKKGDTIAAALVAKSKNGDHYKGQRAMSVKSNVSDKVTPPALSFARPGGVDMLNRLNPADMQKAKLMFTGGNYAVAELNIVATTVAGMKYLTPYLNGISYTREGPKLGGGGGQLMGRFEGVSGGESNHNPMQGMDDEIPF